jgi:methyl coenzyme M reductase subunit C-like uncharacterized protein (methanogenesis marker protein 7)
MDKIIEKLMQVYESKTRYDKSNYSIIVTNNEAIIEAIHQAGAEINTILQDKEKEIAELKKVIDLYAKGNCQDCIKKYNKCFVKDGGCGQWRGLDGKNYRTY